MYPVRPVKLPPRGRQSLNRYGRFALLLGCCGIASSSIAGCSTLGPEAREAPTATIEVEQEQRDTAQIAQEQKRRAEAAQAHARAEAAALEQAALEQERQARELALAQEQAAIDAERQAFEVAFPLHGVTYHFLSRVYASAAPSSGVVGYMRRGAQFRASERVGGAGCKKGWYEVPGDGFICRADGYTIGKEEQIFEPSPVPPALDDALPYAYAWTPKDNVLQYWRLPTVEETTQAEKSLARLIAREKPKPVQAPVPAPSPSAGASEEGVDPPVAADSVEDVASHAVDGADPVVAPPPPGQGPEAADESDEELAADPSLPDYIRQRMRRGFYVSLDRQEGEGNRRFMRSVRGGYIAAEALSSNHPPTFRGVVLGGRWQLPLAFVFRDGTSRLRRRAISGRLMEAEKLAGQSPFTVAEQLDVRGRAYVVDRQGYLVRRNAVRLAKVIERPRGVGETDRWVHVSLAEQILVAYEGDTPVFVTLVSTGRDTFPTPVGTFRIQSKHISTTMDDLNSETEAYLIEDVPWTMYFEGNFALHGAFWHSSFGRQRSHGCVNLSPTDARWLFQWTTPVLPASWHGVFASPKRPGAFVHITP